MRAMLQKIFNVRPASKTGAKQRLKVLLIHDQVDITPAQMDALREELVQVVSRYLEIDAETMEIKLDRQDGEVSLVSSLPVRRVTARAS